MAESLFQKRFGVQALSEIIFPDFNRQMGYGTDGGQEGMHLAKRKGYGAEVLAESRPSPRRPSRPPEKQALDFNIPNPKATEVELVIWLNAMMDCEQLWVVLTLWI